MIEWLKHLPWLQIIAILISLVVSFISYFQSRKSLYESKKANEIAITALSKAEMQFTTLNRPLLIIKPTSFSKNNNYFNIGLLEQIKLIIKMPISIINVGNLVADNTFLHSANSMLYIADSFITGCKKEYETVSKNLTLMDIPPHESVVKIVDFDFQLPPNLDLKKFRDDLISSCRMDTNFLFHYYSHYKQDKVISTNISYAISYNWYSILMIKV
jgi:hypothetical protein